MRRGRLAARQRPETGWIEHCALRVSEKARVPLANARRICVASWWRAMSRAAKRRALKKYGR